MRTWTWTRTGILDRNLNRNRNQPGTDTWPFNHPRDTAGHRAALPVSLATSVLYGFLLGFQTRRGIHRGAPRIHHPRALIE